MSNNFIDEDAVKTVNPFNRPIPGQSLTNSPDEPRPWERPPEITNFREAVDRSVADILEPNTYIEMVVAMSDGIPIRSLVNMFTKAGIYMGKWNPDMALQMIEPLTYVFLGIAEKEGIDPVIESNEEDSDLAETDDTRLQNLNSRNAALRSNLFDEALKVDIEKPRTELPPTIQDALDDFNKTDEQESLLQQRLGGNQSSLLARNEGVA